jgi:Ca2+-dependent lipid-binding protein
MQSDIKVTLCYVVVDNGFNPIWNETCEFDICNPDVALIRFVIQDEDMFGDPNFLGQATYPVKCLRTGNLISYQFSIQLY